MDLYLVLCRSFIPICIVIIGGSVVCAVEPVVLVSTLRQDSLCPGERSVSFTCTTSSQDLFWSVNRRNIFLGNSSQPGQLVRAHPSHVATLLRHTSSGCVSVLDIFNATTSDITVVRCDNGSDFTVQKIEYYHREADQPTQPMNISYVSTKVDHEGTPSNLFSISWSPGNNSNSIIHYVVQLDNNLPVWVRNASATLISDASLGPNHILRLKAVDKCGQKSETVMQVLRATDDATTSTSQFHTAGLLNKGQNLNSFGIFTLIPPLAIYPLL